MFAMFAFQGNDAVDLTVHLLQSVIRQDIKFPVNIINSTVFYVVIDVMQGKIAFSC